MLGSLASFEMTEVSIGVLEGLLRGVLQTILPLLRLLEYVVGTIEAPSQDQSSISVTRASEVDGETIWRPDSRCFLAALLCISSSLWLRRVAFSRSLWST